MHAKAPCTRTDYPVSAEPIIRAGCTRMRARRVLIIAARHADESEDAIQDHLPWELKAQNRRQETSALQICGQCNCLS